MIEVINVNSEGVSADGETYDNIAAPGIVASGYMINQPVVIRYPNGKTFHTNKVLITPAGMKWLERELPIDLRDHRSCA